MDLAHSWASEHPVRRAMRVRIPTPSRPGATLSRWTGAVLIAAGVLLFSAAGAISLRPPAVGAPVPTAPLQIREMEIVAGPSGDALLDSDFAVAVGTAVQVVIVNSDPQSAGAPAGYSASWGPVVGGVQTHWPVPPGSLPSVNLTPAQVAHTFTLQAPFDLNVPIPASSATYGPSWVSFVLYFNETGTFAWHCASYCDDVPGSDGVPMGGIITVTA